MWATKAKEESESDSEVDTDEDTGSDSDSEEDMVDDQPVLSKITLSVTGNKLLAVVGPVGSGKVRRTNYVIL